MRLPAKGKEEKDMTDEGRRLEKRKKKVDARKEYPYVSQ